MHPFQLKGTSGPVINKRFHLEARTVIGSAVDCDIQAESRDISAESAEIIANADGVTIRVLDDGAEIRVNGETVTEKSLFSGDEIQLGNCRWMLQAPGLRPERVLTEEAVKRRRRLWPWIVAVVLVGGVVLAWRLGWIALPGLTG